MSPWQAGLVPSITGRLAGSNEDSSVTDAVVTEANGKSLLFLVTNSADAAAGYNDAGPVQEAVDSWMSSLMVAE